MCKYAKKKNEKIWEYMLVKYYEKSLAGRIVNKEKN